MTGEKAVHPASRLRQAKKLSKKLRVRFETLNTPFFFGIKITRDKKRIDAKNLIGFSGFKSQSF